MTSHEGRIVNLGYSTDLSDAAFYCVGFNPTAATRSPYDLHKLGDYLEFAFSRVRQHHRLEGRICRLEYDAFVAPPAGL